MSPAERRAQSLADALAGNIRIEIPRAQYTQAYVRNLLSKAGVPVDWSWGTRGELRCGTGRLTVTHKDQVYEMLWEPERT